MAENGNQANMSMSRSRSSNHQEQDQAQEFREATIQSAFGNHSVAQGNRVHFQDQMNENVNDASMNVSDHQPDEEAHDIVHDLQGQVPTAVQSGIEQQTAAVLGNMSPDAIDHYNLQQRRRSSSNTNVKGSGSGHRINEALGSFKDIDEMRFSNVEEEDEDASAGGYYNVQVTKGYVVNMEASYQEFNTHLFECNLDFKENIIRQTQTMKLRDTSELNKAVEELKSQEAQELGQLNKSYMKLDIRSKKLDRKNERLESVILGWIDQWRIKRLKKIIFRNHRYWCSFYAREKRQLAYCDDFYDMGLKRRGIKAFKLFAQIAGNRLYEKRIKEKVVIEVDAKVIEKKNQLEFLEGMIRELEEKYRIELRKKAILKSQCDQAYLRGVSAISMEALKMSHSTLADHYKGMKMPNYDGQNIFAQMRSFNGAGTGFKEVIEVERQQKVQQQVQQVVTTTTHVTTTNK